MKNYTLRGLLGLLLGLSFESSCLATGAADYRFSIVEVVVPKPDESHVEYDGELPLDEIPFKQRTDKFQSIGTAWFVDGKTLVSAAHVFPQDFFQLAKHYAIRTIDGSVFEVAGVSGYNNATDLISFTLQTYPPQVAPLKIRPAAGIGTKVCTPGNALGSGIALRCGGEIASMNPEPRDGKWKEIYFSTPVSPGNSGGPLMNAQNEVVGVVVRSIRGESLNIATPIDELAKIKGQAIYTQRGIVYSSSGVSDLRVKANDRATFGLPLPINKFYATLNAEAARIDEKLQTEFKKKWKTLGFFGKKANLEGLRESETIDRPAWVVKNVAALNSYALSPTGVATVRSEKGSELHSYLYNKDDHVVGIPFKKPVDLQQSKSIIDQYLVAVPSYRQIGVSRTRIKSFGKASESFDLKDELGRKWTGFRFPMGFQHEYFSLFCSASVRELYCLDVQDNSALSLKDQTQIFNIRLSELFFPYKGTVKDWDRYLALPDAPSFLKEITIDHSGVEVENLSFKISTHPQTEIALDLRLNPKTLAMEVQAISSSNADNGIVRIIRKYQAPRKDSSKGYRRFYNMLDDLEGGEFIRLTDMGQPAIIGNLATLGTTIVAGTVSSSDASDLTSLYQGLDVENVE